MSRELTLGALPERGGRPVPGLGPRQAGDRRSCSGGTESRRVIPLEKLPDGMFEVLVPGLASGARYRYLVDGEGPFPDPASRYQPEGVHGPSEVVDPAASPGPMPAGAACPGRPGDLRAARRHVLARGDLRRA